MSKQRKRREPQRAVSARTTQATELDRAVTFFGAVVDTFARHNFVQQRTQRALTAYVFGMLLAYGKGEALPPAVVMGVMNLLLVTKFGFGAQAADQRTRELLNATQPGYDTALHSLIYRGIDGLGRWTTAGQQDVLSDFRTCMATLDPGIAL